MAMVRRPTLTNYQNLLPDTDPAFASAASKLQHCASGLQPYDYYLKSEIGLLFPIVGVNLLSFSFVVYCPASNALVALHDAWIRLVLSL